jgi:hypothetical protein
MMSDLRKAIEQALKAWEQGLGHLARDTLKTALSETEQPPRLTDEQIHDIYDQVAKQEPYSAAVTRRNVGRAIESTVRRQFGVTE